jgi:peptidoglycan hydrolase-like protein with peptidoglycan-binding domain
MNQDLNSPQAANPSEDTIRQAQEQLKRHGLYRGAVDGILGPDTRTAIRSFQQGNGLPPTAELDQQTLSRLNATTNSRTMGSGSSSAPGEPLPSSGASAPGAYSGIHPAAPGGSSSPSTGASGAVTAPGR